ncbi:hypothetical protein [Pseudogemmobacter sonorensis]|uniref:hypothetical protein n=1 Tax=Pseudogemmobacter sonorensis TaxID=2989681 RepID=UPI0036B74B09
MSREPYSSAPERWFERVEARWNARAARMLAGRSPYSAGRTQAGPFVLVVVLTFALCATVGAVVGEWLIARGASRGIGAAVLALFYAVGPLIILTTLAARSSLRAAARAKRAAEEQAE